MYVKLKLQHFSLIAIALLAFKRLDVECTYVVQNNNALSDIKHNAIVTALSRPKNNANAPGRQQNNVTVPGGVPMGCSPVQDETCACKMTDGSGNVDISSLAGSTGSPKFQDVQGTSDNSKYSFSPCGTFTEGSCQEAAMCMTSGEIQEQIGDGQRIIFIYDQSSKSPVAAYTHRTPEFMFVSEVILKCDPNACDPTFEPKGQKEAHYFSFELTSVCACPGQCTASGPTNCKSKSPISSAVSGGTILIIGFAAASLLYLVIGIVYGMAMQKATGTEVIPNKAFWVSFPGLVKTGVLFTIGMCRRGKTSYDSI